MKILVLTATRDEIAEDFPTPPVRKTVNIVLKCLMTCFPGATVVVTGIGNTLATYNTVRAMLAMRAEKDAGPVDLVINLGMAGSPNLEIGTVVIGSHVVDFDRVPAQSQGDERLVLPLATGAVVSCIRHLAPIVVPVLSFNRFIGARDPVLQKIPAHVRFVADMEAFSEAFVADSFGVPVASVKVVSDNLDPRQYDDSIGYLRRLPRRP